MPELSRLPRPVLRTFRVLSLSGQSRGEALATKLQINLLQDIGVGLIVPTVPGAPLMAGVVIKLQVKDANAHDAGAPDIFAAEYEAKFLYADDVTEDAATPPMEDREYQRGLVAQAYPLAMTHLRREVQALGLDTREFPLGLAE